MDSQDQVGMDAGKPVENSTTDCSPPSQDAELSKLDGNARSTSLATDDAAAVTETSCEVDVSVGASCNAGSSGTSGRHSPQTMANVSAAANFPVFCSVCILRVSLSLNWLIVRLLACQCCPSEPSHALSACAPTWSCTELVIAAAVCCVLGYGTYPKHSFKLQCV